MVSQINSNAGATGVTATYDSSAGLITLSTTDGRNIDITQTAANTQGAGFTSAAAGANNTVNDALDLTTVTNAAVAQTFVGSVHLSAANTITLAGAGAVAIGYTAGALALGASALNSAAVTTAGNANTTINMIDAALTAVSSLRSSLGAMQSRFESVVSSLQTASENLSTSRSRIQDADFAAETAKLTRAQILSQAGTAILAQANAAPQSVLKLLQ